MPTGPPKVDNCPRTIQHMQIPFKIIIVVQITFKIIIVVHIMVPTQKLQQALIGNSLFRERISLGLCTTFYFLRPINSEHLIPHLIRLTNNLDGIIIVVQMVPTQKLQQALIGNSLFRERISLGLCTTFYFWHSDCHCANIFRSIWSNEVSKWSEIMVIKILTDVCQYLSYERQYMIHNYGFTTAHLYQIIWRQTSYFKAAQWSGVTPSLSLRVGSAPLSIKSFTQFWCPL